MAHIVTNNYTKSESDGTDLEIQIVDKGQFREVFVNGPHRALSIVNSPATYKTGLSMQYLNLLKKIGYKEWFVNEMLRTTDSSIVEKPIIELLNQSGGIPEGKILDFACGSGAVIKAILSAANSSSTFVYGVEIDPQKRELATQLIKDYHFENNSEVFVLENSKVLPFQNDEFDMIILNAVYEHFLPDERKELCLEFERVLKPGGRLCLRGTPNRLWPVEFHTSELPLVSYLPTKIAYKVARRYSYRISKNESLENCLRMGLIGATWWEIKRNLPNMDYVHSNEFNRIFRPNSIKGKKKVLLLPALLLEYLICRPLKISLSSFAMSLDFALTKRV